MVGKKCRRGGPLKGTGIDLGLMARIQADTHDYAHPLSIEYNERMSKEHLNRVDGPVSYRRMELSPKQASERIKRKAFELGADLVGFTVLEPSFIIKDEPVAGRWAISLALEMDYDRIARSPKHPSSIEVSRTYYELGNIAIELANYIRSLGYNAIVHHPRGFNGRVGAVFHKPVAQKAGLGEIGRHSMLITPEFGPRIRLATVSTELKLVATHPLNLGIARYCDQCAKCVQKCPVGAIPKHKTAKISADGKKRLRKKVWRIDVNSCIPQFIKTDGCAICIKECTFNQRPERAIPFVEKVSKRKFSSRARCRPA